MTERTQQQAGRSISDLKALVGSDIGGSDWMTVSQAMINQFADLTDDHQFIHVDPKRAAKTPFGGTVAHGFLTLSLLSRLAAGVNIAVQGLTMGVNYGFDRVRLVTPVPAGGRIRGIFRLAAVEERAPGQLMLTLGVTVEIDGVERPALSADWLTLQFFDPEGGAA